MGGSKCLFDFQPKSEQKQVTGLRHSMLLRIFEIWINDDSKDFSDECLLQVDVPMASLWDHPFEQPSSSLFLLLFGVSTMGFSTGTCDRCDDLTTSPLNNQTTMCWLRFQRCWRKRWGCSVNSWTRLVDSDWALCVDGSKTISSRTTKVTRQYLCEQVSPSVQLVASKCVGPLVVKETTPYRWTTVVLLNFRLIRLPG